MPSRLPSPARVDGAWHGFVRTALASGAVALLALWASVIVLDPYGLRARPGTEPRPLMDLNQRFMYPQLARGGRFDSAVFGTSTVRLLDPERLERAFGGRFVNLGINAGTPWEQMALARLFLRHVPAPRMLVFGLDRTWCEADADSDGKRVTFRTFPPWLYGDPSPWDWPEMLNLRSLEIAGRLALHRLGLVPERIRGDGYEVFTPPEASYDLSRARFHIYAETENGNRGGSRGSGDRLRPSENRFPALDWLRALLADVPAETRVVVLHPPVHVVSQARPGSRDAAIDAECRRLSGEIAQDHGGLSVDFRLPSTLTRADENYWDKLHYRQPIAERIVSALRAALGGSGEPPDGSYRVLSR